MEVVTKRISERFVWAGKKGVIIRTFSMAWIETVEDVLEYLSVGASAVQIGTASFADPRASEHLLGTLTNALVRLKASNISDIQEKFASKNG